VRDRAAASLPGGVEGPPRSTCRGLSRGAGTGPGGAVAPGAGVAGAGTSGDALTSAGPGTAAGGPRLVIDMTEDQLKQLPEYRQGGNMWVRQAPQ
jgi:hypothetical protein